MTMLRRLADAGRVIVVVTHSLTFLDLCDQVLLFAPGGKIAFFGPPDELGPAMGATDWADIFTTVSADPDSVQRRFMERTDQRPTNGRARKSRARTPRCPSHRPSGADGEPARTSVWRQFSTIARRQVRLLVADRGYLAFLVVLPFIVGLLPLTVTGHAGFGHPPPDGSAPFEPKHVIALISFAAILMGRPSPCGTWSASGPSSAASSRPGCRPRRICWPRSRCSERSP